ncbi:MAG: alcohol dehydrogenase, partial [Phototrophicales bacterium]
LVQYNGRICILADGNREPLTLAPDFHAKELTLVASSDGWDYHQHAAWFFEVIRREKPPLAQLFEHEMMATQLLQIFEKLATGELSPVKILVRYK